MDSLEILISRVKKSPQAEHQYPQHPILWVVLNISTKNEVVLRTGLNKSTAATHYQVGWINCTARHLRNSDNIMYKTPKPCNKSLILKSTDLLQSQKFIEN